MNKVIALLATGIIYAIDPFEDVWLLIFVYIAILALYNFLDKSNKEVKHRRSHTRKYDYELYEELPDGTIEPVKGSRQ